MHSFFHVPCDCVDEHMPNFHARERQSALGSCPDKSREEKLPIALEVTETVTDQSIDMSESVIPYF